MAIDWSKGYSSTCYAKRVDPATWRDVEVIELTGGTIKREPTGKRQSADISCVRYHIDVEQWIRVYMDVQQSGASDHVALFTGLATSPDDDINGTLVTNSLACYSVLKPAEDVILQRGWYASAGANGAKLVRRLLSVTPAPVIISDSSPVLSDTIVAEDGETHLSMVDRILSAINWRLRISGDGTIYVTPYSADPAAVFDPIGNDLIEPKIKVSQDWYNCPNVYMAVAGDVTGIARDEDPESMFSVANRGREVWKRETGCALAANETVAEYALRKLKEAQHAKQKASYSRRFVPDVYPEDCVSMRYHAQGLDGLYTVSSQSITLGYGARTSEQIYKE
jgi:hypothetical protein